MSRYAVACVLCLSFVTFAGEKESPSELFQAKSVWQGVADPDPRWAERREVASRLRVIERTGDDFVAQIAFTRKNGVHAARLEGKIRKGEIAAHITKIIKGDWGPDAVEIVWRGQIDGENLLLSRTNDKNMTATCRLKLEKNPKKSDD